MEKKDIIIIGGGPAGLTAGIYASREKLKTLIIEKKTIGGLPSIIHLIENYPGFPDGISGIELISRIRKQAEKFGTEIKDFEEAKNIIPQEGRIIVKTDKDEYEAISVIIATGSLPKPLNVPGEREFIGKGVSYCATCDGPFYKNKEVAIIGSGSSSLQEGETLLKFVRKITFVARSPYIKGEKILQESLKKNSNVEFLLNHVVTSINGNDTVTSITVKDRNNGKEREIKVSGVFVYIGFLPNSGFVKDVVKLDEEGYIITNEKMETSVPGIFAAGDIRSGQVRQISTACGSAVTAIINANHYIRKIKSDAL